jgi:hypothetical protein
MLHCFGLLPPESAGWIPIKQAHSIEVPSYSGMSRKDGNCQSQEMPTQLKQVVGSSLSSKLVSLHTAEQKKLPVRKLINSKDITVHTHITHVPSS